MFLLRFVGFGCGWLWMVVDGVFVAVRFNFLFFLIIPFYLTFFF